MTDTDIFIDNRQALAGLISGIAQDTTVSLDTEFVRERTYYPRLCLIQIATPKLTACIDCLADLDMRPLFESLLDARSTWVLHSARQDLEVIHQHTDRLPARLIDTQIAAGLLGYPPQISLQDLLQKVLGIRLDKTYVRTDWAERPLPEPAMRYALEDVRHLNGLWQALKAELQHRHRLGWLEEDCRLALDAPLVTPAATLWARLKGLGSLEARARCAALSLVEWRERCARKLNRPRRWIMSDALLLRIADTLPTTREELASVAEMPRRLMERFGGDILAAAAEQEASERLSFVEACSDKPRPDNDGLKRLRDDAKRRARELGIHPEVLATRRELSDLLVGTMSGRAARGWRWKELRDPVRRSHRDATGH